jgi:hypothetical protein
MGSMIGSGVITFILTTFSAVIFFFMLMLGLNGFMGQQRAVNASFGTYIVLAGLVVIVATAISILTTVLLKRRLNWHAVLAVLLPAVSFSAIAGLMHFGCIVIAAIVAEEMRTGR